MADSKTFQTKRNELDIQREVERKIMSVFDEKDYKCKKAFMTENMLILIKESIMHVFEKDGTRLEVEKLYTSLTNDENFELVSHVIENAVTEYSENLKERVLANMDKYEWEIPKTMFVSKCPEIPNPKTVHKDCYRDYGDQFTKYAMKPTYLEIASTQELHFCRYLDRAPNVKWWFKNGVGGNAFSVLYEDDCKTKRFMVDYIVMTNDGKIGLFDPKDGRTLKDAGPKAKGLAEYIKENHALNLFGGIITERDGKWIVSDGHKFSTSLGDSSWSELDLYKVE